MQRFSSAVVGLMMLGAFAQAATGKHIAKAVLVSRTGAPVATASADANGSLQFNNVPPGEYKIIVTNADGRSVTLSDLDGDGFGDIVIEGKSAFTATGTFSDGTSKTAPAPSGGGTGKVSVSSFNIMKTTAPGTPAAPGTPGAPSSITSPRDTVSGMATGKRMHKPYCVLMDWDGTVKGGFASESTAKAEGQRLPEHPSGRCAVRVVVDERPGTIEVQSWSWGASNSSSYVGTVTIVK